MFCVVRTRYCGFACAALARSTLIGALLIGVVTPALGADASDDSVEQGATPIDRLEFANPQAGQVVVPPPETEAQRRRFFHDAELSAQLRTCVNYGFPRP